MITKSAVAAWKQMMPYLGDAAQQRLMKFRKPLAEYNKSVARSNDVIANKLGVNTTTLNNTATNPLSYRAISDDPADKIYTSMDGLFGAIDKDAYINEAEKVLANKNLRPDLRRTAQRELSKLKEIPDRQKAAPMLYVSDSMGNAKGDYLRNSIMRHELDEAKNTLRYYKISDDGKYYIPKNGIQLAAPSNEVSTTRNTMTHASLDVLKDELKNAFKSGYMDRYATPEKYFNLAEIRTKTNEIPDIIKTRALASKKRDYLNNIFAPDMEELKAGKEYFTRGDVKKMQSQFFTDMRRQQSRNNIRSSEPVPIGKQPEYNLFGWTKEDLDKFRKQRR